LSGFWSPLNSCVNISVYKKTAWPIAYAVSKVRPRTHSTCKATTTLLRGVFAFFCGVS